MRPELTAGTLSCVNDSLPAWLSTRPACYADTEDGDYVEDPGHVAILSMLAGLNTSDNSFFTIYPDAPDADWSISVRIRPEPPGDYEIECRDAAASEHATSMEADHATITEHVLGWISRR